MTIERESPSFKEDIEALLREANHQLIEAVKNQEEPSVILELQLRIKELQTELARKQQETNK